MTVGRWIAGLTVFVAGVSFVDFTGALLSAPRFTRAVSGTTSSTSAHRFVSDEVLVKFKATRSAQDRIAAIGVRGHGVMKELRQPGWARVKLRENESVPQAVAAYRNDPAVEYAQPNYVYRAAAAPNDPHYGQLWGFKNTGTLGADINIENAWNHITDCSSVIVAVLDTGINYNHDDLAANMWKGAPGFPLHGADFVDDDNDPMDLNGHGTHVAGIIGAAGNNATGAVGVCWKASLMALRVLDVKGMGSTATVIQAINFAVEHGAKVMNMSFSGAAFDQAVSDALEHARSNHVLVVSAAGNDGLDLDLFGLRGVYPCQFAHANLLCVGALDQNFGIAGFSNVGEDSVDVGAPGANILSVSAGVRNTLSDTFNTAGTLNWTSFGGWDYVFSPDFGHLLVNPRDVLSGGSYAAGVDQRVYKDFDLRGKASVILNLSIEYDLLAGLAFEDLLKLNSRVGGADPFAGGLSLDNFRGGWSGGILDLSYDLSACAGTICSLGFQLSSLHGWGYVVILGVSADMLQLSNTSYETHSGTSMATPYVAGLAAMLLAYNPEYKYADLVNAVRKGSHRFAFSPPPFLGRTPMRVVDFMASLAHINPPTGLKATVTR